jgi:ABC-type transporter Mla subunit MlaD
MIVIPESLASQKTDLEAALVKITEEQAKLATQRKDIEGALTNLNTVLNILSGKTPVPVTPAAPARKPMSPEARQRISEALKKAAAAKKEKAAVAQSATATHEPAKVAEVLNQDTRAISEALPDADAPKSAMPKEPTPVVKTSDTRKPASKKRFR